MKFGKATTPFKLVLVTENRDQLCALAQTLFEGMNPALFMDPRNPVVVTVRGAYNSGKTIFPDIIREACIPDAACTSRAVKENNRLDEAFTGIYLGNPFEFTFINTSINSPHITRFDYSHTAIHQTDRDQDRGTAFIGIRDHGGITFIHNDDNAVLRSAIDIWIEDGINPVEGTCEESRMNQTSFRAAFNEEGVHRAWKRYVEVSIYDLRLFSDATFMKKLGKIKGLVAVIATEHALPQKPTPRPLTQTQRRQPSALYLEKLF